MRRVGLALVAVFAVAASFGAGSASAQAATPTFAKDVAPILYKNCVICHRPGEVAPMSLIGYNDVRPWAKAIKDKVSTRQMPPWGAGPADTKYKNDRSLSQKDIDTVVAWVNGGAQRGDDKDMPAMPSFAQGWANGRDPDAILQLPVDVPLPAEGEIDVKTIYTDTPFKEDVFVKALEVRPGVNAAVHHAGVYLVEKLPEGAKIVDGKVIGTDGEEVSGREINRVNGLLQFQENTKLLSFVPGRGYEEYQGGAGQRIKANSFVDFSMHYQATGKPEIDRTKIGLYLAKNGEVDHQIFHGFDTGDKTTYLVEGKEIDRGRRGGGDSTDDNSERSSLPPIPPYADNFQIVSVYPLSEAITVYGLTPHFHLRGKDMKYVATYPDGHEQVLLNVPKYDFNWQLYYEMAEPVKLPAGSKVTVITHFDNSLKNPYNPAPHLAVNWSEQSWDEMYSPQARITIDSRDLRKPKAAPAQQQQQ